jgi:outer membrane protein assembly factor BamA
MIKVVLRFIIFTIGFASIVYAQGTSVFDYKLVFEGNSAFSDDELEENLALPDEFKLVRNSRKDFLMSIAKDNLNALYYAAGYFSLDLQLKESIIQSKGIFYKVYSFKISENERYTFGKSNIEIPADAVVLFNPDELTLASGEPYNFEDISQDLIFIRGIYKKAGYLHMKVRAREVLNEELKQVLITFEINPGHLVIMGDIFAESNRGTGGIHQEDQAGLTDPKFLRSLWTIEKQDKIDGSYFTEFRSKLFGTRIFSRIELKDSLRSDGSGLSDIYLSAVERPPGHSRVGLFWEENYKLGVTGFSSHKNILGNFNELSAQAIVAQRKTELIIGYANPLLFGTAIRWIPTAIRWDNKLILNYEKLPLPAYPDSLEERYDIAGRGDLSFGLSSAIRFIGTTDLRYVHKPLINEDLVKLKFEFGLDFNHTNSMFEPTKGIRFRPLLGNSGKFSGKGLETRLSQRYWYTQLKTNAYIPLVRYLTSAYEWDYGHYFKEGIEEDARLFYQGGSRNVRGYRFRSIFPRQTLAASDPTEPDLILTGLTPRYHRLTQELRWDLPFESVENFQVVQFLDWARIEDANPAFTPAQEMGLGSGLRYHLFNVLTLRLDYTFKKEFKSLYDSEPWEWDRISIDLSQAI